MPSKLRSSRSTSSFKLKTLSAAIVSALVLSNAYAAGLGKLTVMSSLGQPLRAEIELTSVAADEAGSLVPKLASAEAFRQANVDLNPALLSLRFAVEQRNGTQVIRVTSTQPINEPFVDMLLELGGSKGRLVREYTFLLDPPEMRNQQSAQVGSSVSTRSLPPQVSQPAARPAPVAQEPVREREAPARAPARSERAAAVPKPEAANGADEYQVKKGDSLAKIAGQFRSEGVSLDQMLVALYRANPDAFIGKNMNRLRAGQILAVPAADDAKSVSTSEANGVVLAQAADFNSYRNKLAGQVATASPKQSDDTRQTSGGKITTKIQEQSGTANESKDKLKLSKSGTNLPAGSDKLAGASAEDLIAKDKAIAEANARVKELEKNVGDLQKLLEIKNRDLADQQKQAEAAKAVAPVVAAAPTPAAPAPVAPVAAAPASSVEAETVATPASAVVTEPVSAVAAAPVIPPVVAKPKPKVVVTPPPEPPGFFEDLTNNGLFLPGAAAILALLAGLGIYSARRRKQPKSFEDSIISDSTLKSNSLFGSTGGQSVDTNNSVFNSNFVPSASQLDTNEVDPIAEADVYIAYGRDAQAEEILKEALRNQPDRHAVRVKLLEIYANRKDVRSFEILATELYGMTKGEGEDWQQAANLGAILDPGNPMYSSDEISEDVALRASALSAPTRPMDEQTMDALLETTQAKTSLDTDTIETSPYFGSTTLLADEAMNAQPVAKPIVEEKSDVEDLDFDLEGLGLEGADKKAAETELPADIAAIDFDFLDKEPEAAAAAAEDHSDLADLSFDLNEAPAMPTPVSAPEVLVPEAMGLDFPSSQSTADDVKTSETEKLPEFDLSDIELDLSPSAASTSSVADAAAELPSLEGLADEEPYTSNAEMATKLDLAIAYQEIGDKEGARELLEEVVKGGDPDQSEKAKNLLGKLS